ncbi:ArsA-related P-loop ATPase [Escherichia coli]|uniref:ArsA-related P-loop ATPase n=1 Tax=Escherichia coli TaxID=562 RepID=UPI000D8EFB7A|nr:Arsenical pump-driving ATPase [Escherichia coli]
MMQLQDQERTKVLLVTLPETTPVLEAANLQSDLERAGIHPWGWIINTAFRLHRRNRRCFASAPYKASSNRGCEKPACKPHSVSTGNGCEPTGIEKLRELVV